MKETRELLGTELINVEEEYEKFEIAYNLGKKAWGFGYITEAMQEVIKFDKEELSIKEIMERHTKVKLGFGNIPENIGVTYIKDIPYECKEYILNL